MITRKTDYALRVLRTLSEGGQFTVGQICEKEMLPQQFTYKLLKKLERAGMLQISRGAEGGCRLTADLEDYSLYDLMHIMEEDGYVSECMEPGFECAWMKKKHTQCTVHRHLYRIQKALDEELRAHSLARILFDED